MRTRSSVQRLPGMEVAVAGTDLSSFDAFRLGPNDWGFLAQPADAAVSDRDVALDAVRAHAVRHFRPSTALKQLAPSNPAVFARLELDKCGAWITLAALDHPRPIVVRRAGWIDVRGHVTGADDRVGLGPGDAIVVVTQALVDTSDAVGERFGDEGLPESLLDCAGASAEELAAHLLDDARQFTSGDTSPKPGLAPTAAAFVARVPEEPGRDPLERVVVATGIPAGELQLPGYPLGDEQPDLWSRPPDPPREARMRLAPVPASVASMRALLERLQVSWRMPGATDGVIELLATELAANAIKHAQSSMTVIVRYLGNVIRVEVGDGSRELPRPRQASDDDLDGRGLALVDALAADWGVLPTRTGKRVWCDVAIDTGLRQEGDG